MNELLVCSSDPLFMKSLYGLLRHLGFGVTMTDHAAHAVQMSLGGDYAAALFDSQCIGMQAGDAVRILNNVRAEMPVIIAGDVAGPVNALTVSKPLDLVEVTQAIRSVCIQNTAKGESETHETQRHYLESL